MMKAKITQLVFILFLLALKATSQSLTIDSIYVTNATTCSLCNGYVIADVSGGIPPYTYYWNNVGHADTSSRDTGLCPGDTILLFVYDSLGNIARSYFYVVGPQPASIGIYSYNK
jgi:AGCS family alanine or glycine:cation symporter